MRWMAPFGLAVLPLLACGDSVTTTPPAALGVAGEGGAGGLGGAGGSDSTTSSSDEGGGGASVTPQACPDGQFVAGVAEDGTIACEPLGDVPAVIDSACSLYLAWRDSCEGCTDDPSKWGRAGATCAVGAGQDNTCLELGEQKVPLFGLNTDGDVNGDDQFWLGLYCPDRGDTAAPGPCEPGELVVGIHAGHVECLPAARYVSRYLRDHCSLYFGWRDNCDGCTDPPAKWGRVPGPSCKNGIGTGNTCGASFLDQQWIPQFGLNPDGDVDDNDKLYLGLHCADPDDAETKAKLRCPAGSFVFGVNADGTLRCRSPYPLVAPVVQQSCFAYFGWRDSCNGCTDPPAKWGRVGHGTCELGAGSDSGCISTSLDGKQLELLGVDTDGDVNGDDKLYVGWRCLPNP